MAFSRSKLRKTAQKLLGVTAGDLKESITFTKKGGFDYSSQSSSSTEYTLDRCLVTSSTVEDISTNENIQKGDKKVICEYSDDFEITSDDTTCIIDSVEHDIIMVDDKFKVFYIFFARVK